MNMAGILKYEHDLKEAGINDIQAKVIAKGLADVVDGNLATKVDLKNLESSIRQELVILEQRLTIKLTSIMAGMFVFAITAVGFLIKYL